MKKVKDTLVLNNDYNIIDLNSIDLVELEADGSVIFPDEVEIDVEEFNYQLKAVIASYQNLINQNGSKIMQNSQYTKH